MEIKKYTLNDYWVTEEIIEESKNSLETNKKENTTYLNLQNRTKAVLKGKFLAITAYI
jgi:hypothetical protein